MTSQDASAVNEELEKEIQKAMEEEYDTVPLWKTALDPYGRRSMAFRRQKTGRVVTFTELNEQRWAHDAIMRHWFNRHDKILCWMLYEGVRPGILRKTLQFLSYPLMWICLGYNHLRLSWDIWKESRSQSN